MNKIVITDDNLEKVNISKNINLEYYEKECMFAINELKINIKKNETLDLIINLCEGTKLNFDINLDKNVKLDLNIITKGKNGKVQYKYNLKENSFCNIIKFQNIDSIKEMIVVNLNGDNSRIDYNFKTIGNKKETYDYHIFHNSINSISNIKNNGVCIGDGTIIFQVSSFVPKNVIGCVVNQNNRIINLTENKCEIKPNLYIDCNDVEASHSALIGKFSDEEMFYMQSRGIDYDSTIKLLIMGFLTSDINSKGLLKTVKNNIKKYWR